MERDVLIDLQTFDRYTAIAHIRLTERMTEGEELIPGVPARRCWKRSCMAIPPSPGAGS